MSRFLRAIGWAAVAGGLLYAVVAGLIEPSLPNHTFGPSDTTDLLVGSVTTVVGLLFASLGELIGVAFAIEANTRRVADLLEATRTSK